MNIDSKFPSDQINHNNLIVPFISKLRNVQKNIKKIVANVTGNEVSTCVECMNQTVVETAIYDSLRLLREKFICPVLNCCETLKKGRGVEGKNISSLGFSCGVHGRIKATKLIGTLPDEILYHLFAHYGFENMFKFFEKHECFDVEVLLFMKNEMINSNLTANLKENKQTSITDFVTTNMMEPILDDSFVAAAKNSALSQSQTASSAIGMVYNGEMPPEKIIDAIMSLNPQDPIILCLMALCKSLLNQVGCMASNINELKEELKAAKICAKPATDSYNSVDSFFNAVKRGSEKQVIQAEAKIQEQKKPSILKPSENEIRYALRKSAPQNLDPLLTIHLTGLSRCKITTVKKIFNDCGVILHKIKDISFIGNRVMEIILFENYCEEFFHHLKSLETRVEYKGLKVERINFDPFSKDNFKTSGKKSDAAEANMPQDSEAKFKERLLKKIVKLKEREKLNPSLKRTRRYVERQLELKSYVVPITHYEENQNLASFSTEQFSQQEKFNSSCKINQSSNHLSSDKGATHAGSDMEL